LIGKSRVNVIDSNRPGDVILTFDIHAANVLCIATVAGIILMINLITLNVNEVNKILQE
jgi:hypothetical protein